MSIPSGKTPAECSGSPVYSVFVAVATAAVSLLISACSCPWSPPPAENAPAATLTWDGDADLDLELYRLPPDLPDSAPVEALDRVDVDRDESVNGHVGERIVFLPTRDAGRFLLAARFWSVGPSNTRRVSATISLKGINSGNGADPITFTAELDDDSADLWFPCVLDLDKGVVLTRGDTRVAGL